MRLLPVMILVLSIWSVGLGGLESQPSDHGLANEPPVGEATPAMRAFFLNGSSTLPEAAAGRNQSGDPLWDLVGRPVPHQDTSGSEGGAQSKRRTAFLAAGIASGTVGVGLLTAAAAIYVLQRRRERRGTAPWAELRRTNEIL